MFADKEFKDLVKQLATKHFGEKDAQIYETMIDYMEAIMVEFGKTACLEANTELFVRFLNEVGQQNFYDHVGRINQNSPIVAGVSKKAAFEAELQTLQNMLKQQQKDIKEDAQKYIEEQEAQRLAMENHIGLIESKSLEVQVLQADIQKLTGQLIDKEGEAVKKIDALVLAQQFKEARQALADLRADTLSMEALIESKELDLIKASQDMAKLLSVDIGSFIK